MSDEAALWLHNFKQIMSFVDVAHDNFRAAPNSRGVAEKSVKEGLRRGVFHHLLDERAREAISSAQLRRIVERVRSAVDEFLNEHLTTPQQLVSRLGEIASVAGEAVATINEMPDEEDVVQVVDEFEIRYLVTLATTMSAHHTLATKLVERKESDGQLFDIATYSFVSEPGLGRVHVADLNNAMDSGAGSYSFTRGMVSYDRFPPVQIMIYGQWFAYIHAVWDEWYRPRLAAAYSRTLGDEYLKNDVKSAFMGELNKIRNDVIHN
ncbi:hypothetical protein JF780_27355, partial [Mycobacterium intracellulare]|nr:hypothetical protein [Mycobacterium intracellulare]